MIKTKITDGPTEEKGMRRKKGKSLWTWDVL